MKNDDIEKRIAEAPEPFRARLERLHREGLLADPKFKEAVLYAAQRVRERTEAEWATSENAAHPTVELQTRKNIDQHPVQNPPPKLSPEKRGFPNDPRPSK